MKFSNLHWLSAVLLVVGLNSCTSVSDNDIDNSELASTKNAKTLLSIEPESSDPWQHKAQALKALPNRYLMQATNSEIPLPVSGRFAQGQEFISQQKWAEAQALFLNLAEQYPLLSGIWLQLAHIQKSQLAAKADVAAQQQARDLQSRYLNNALSANADNYVAHNQLALVLRQQGQFALALQHYDLALASWPAFPEARLNRAILNDLYVGNKIKALEDYQLYQALLTEPSRQVKSWIADLERQVQRQQQEYNANSGSIKGESQ